jgi:hypothetical protein
MIAAGQIQHLRKRWKEMAPVLNEQSRRRWAATEARALGRGGVSCLVRVTGLARRTVYRGLDDIRRRHKTDMGRIRKRGGGRKPKIAHDPTLLRDLKTLVHPSGIEGLILGSWGYAIRREASLRRSSGGAWPWWR